MTFIVYHVEMMFFVRHIMMFFIFHRIVMLFIILHLVMKFIVHHITIIDRVQALSTKVMSWFAKLNMIHLGFSMVLFAAFCNIIFYLIAMTFDIDHIPMTCIIHEIMTSSIV